MHLLWVYIYTLKTFFRCPKFQFWYLMRWKFYKIYQINQVYLSRVNSKLTTTTRWFTTKVAMNWAIYKNRTVPLIYLMRTVISATAMNLRRISIRVIWPRISRHSNSLAKDIHAQTLSNSTFAGLSCFVFITQYRVARSPNGRSFLSSRSLCH